MYNILKKVSIEYSIKCWCMRLLGKLFIIEENYVSYRII